MCLIVVTPHKCHWHGLFTANSLRGALAAFCFSLMLFIVDVMVVFLLLLLLVIFPYNKVKQDKKKDAHKVFVNCRMNFSISRSLSLQQRFLSSNILVYATDLLFFFSPCIKGTFIYFFFFAHTISTNRNFCSLWHLILICRCVVHCNAMRPHFFCFCVLSN